MTPASVTYDVKMARWVLTEDFSIRINHPPGIKMVRWVVTEDFSIRINHPPGIDLSIAEGYITDLASIPRLLWRVVAPFELSITAPLVHDLFYQNTGCGIYSRKDVDLIFLQLMKREGVSWWRRSIAYHAVRIFGGLHWKGEKK